MAAALPPPCLSLILWQTEPAAAPAHTGASNISKALRGEVMCGCSSLTAIQHKTHSPRNDPTCLWSLLYHTVYLEQGVKDLAVFCENRDPVLQFLIGDIPQTLSFIPASLQFSVQINKKKTSLTYRLSYNRACIYEIT